MVVEAGLVVGYVVAWALRKAKRVGKRLDSEADVVIDAGLNQLHEVVADRLGGHPVLAELVDEAEQAGQVSDLTFQQVELAVKAAALKDESFARTITELVTRLQTAEQVAGPVVAGPGAAVFTGNVTVEARDNATGIGQVQTVIIGREPPGPSAPGRPGR